MTGFATVAPEATCSSLVGPSSATGPVPSAPVVPAPSVPAAMRVPPVYGLAAFNVREAGPVLMRPPAPWIWPENVAPDAWLTVRKVPLPKLTCASVPPPPRPPIVGESVGKAAVISPIEPKLSAPVPAAVSLANVIVPSPRWKPPENPGLLPVRVRVEVPYFRIVPVPAPLSAMVPDQVKDWGPPASNPRWTTSALVKVGAVVRDVSTRGSVLYGLRSTVSAPVPSAAG